MKKKQKQKNMLHHNTLSVYKRDFYSHVFAHPVRHIYIYIVYIQTFNILQKRYN